MRAMIAGLMLVLGLTAQQAPAQDRPVVIELYTSQGCSSCPPADELIAQLAKRSDVIPLALHVDYWDYIGWKDEFASPAYTRRQKAYAQAAGHRTIYTPQIIVGGVDHVVGYKPMQLAELIQSHRASQRVIDMTLTRKGDKVEIRARALADLPEAMVVQLVRYRPSETVRIERGENAGRTIVYANIVTQWRRLGDWDGRSQLALAADATGPLPVVALIQTAGHGAILAAAALR